MKDTKDRPWDPLKSTDPANRAVGQMLLAAKQRDESVRQQDPAKRADARTIAIAVGVGGLLWVLPFAHELPAFRGMLDFLAALFGVAVAVGFTIWFGRGLWLEERAKRRRGPYVICCRHCHFTFDVLGWIAHENAGDVCQRFARAIPA